MYVPAALLVATMTVAAESPPTLEIQFQPPGSTTPLESDGAVPSFAWQFDATGELLLAPTPDLLVGQAHRLVSKLAVLPLCEGEAEISERLMRGGAEADLRRPITRKRK